jgi:hypothetical protein
VDCDLVFKGRRYPPKTVLGLAGAFATGAPMSQKDFRSGELLNVELIRADETPASNNGAGA